LETIARIARVLNLVGTLPSGLTLSEISEALSLPKSTTFRMLQALGQKGMLRKDERTKLYCLGPAVLGLAASALDQSDIRSVAQAPLQELAAVLNETVYVTVLYGENAIVELALESERRFQHLIRTGKPVPLHCASAAKAIIAYHEEEKIDQLLGDKVLQRFTPRTTTDLAQLKQELRQIRKQGYAVCDEEIEPGVRALSVPVCDRTGQVCASISVLGPTGRLDAEKQQAMLPHLWNAARQVSRSLGCRLDVLPS